MWHRASNQGLSGAGICTAISCLLIALVALAWSFSSLAEAQGSTEDLAGEAAEIVDTEDTDKIVNQVVVDAAGCEVAGGAVVTVADADGTEVRLVDGGNVETSATEDQVVMEGNGSDGNLGYVEVSGDEFEAGTGEVISSSGITCGAGDTPADEQYDDDDGNNDDDGNDDDGDGNDDGGGSVQNSNNGGDVLNVNNNRATATGGADDEQYRKDDVIVKTIRQGKLPNTGGPPLLLLPWAVALVAVGISVVRRS